ncbi:hypothetical protein [Polyangium mundeleinium]|uniref:Cytochrome c domain-containing protein n=1 Tax=Polyangium mundeleinium TaxID=2995306 RepID=A0ABT5ESH6_9BACT|nr:hypothetical protein [Polyangium mundeleinium]MDC0744773.1 hypothetical protein [Polyangium mundeleinium]
MNRKRISMAVCLFVAACGGEDPEPAAEPIAYKDMSFAERVVFMNDVVLPEMKEVFVAFDPKFEAMDCATCHGQGATDGTYTMPSAQIAPLPGTEEAFLEYVKDPEAARWSQFMFDEVMTRMADLIQVPTYNPETHADGFSCAGCHTMEVPPGGTP